LPRLSIRSFCASLLHLGIPALTAPTITPTITRIITTGTGGGGGGGLVLSSFLHPILMSFMDMKGTEDMEEGDMKGTEDMEEGDAGDNDGKRRVVRN